MTTTLARPEVSPAVHAGRRLLLSHLVLLLWFWSIVVVAVVGVTAILAAYDVTSFSVVSFARQAGIWFPFSLEIIVATTYLRAHVAAGMTRRSFVTVALAVAVVVALLNAAFMATALTVERLAHGRLGWSWELADALLDPTGRSWPLLFLDYGLTYVVGNVSGLLVGIVFYAAAATWGPVRGGWVGTLLIPLTAGPILVVLSLVALQGGEGPDRLAVLSDPTVGQTAAIGLAIAALMAAVFALVARRTAISRPRS